MYGHFKQHLQLMSALPDFRSEPIQIAGMQISELLTKSGILFWCGNGGSVADSQNEVAELLALRVANELGINTIALLGEDGGRQKHLLTLRF